VSGLLRDSAHVHEARSRCQRCCPGVAVISLDRPPHRARGRHDLLIRRSGHTVQGRLSWVGVACRWSLLLLSSLLSTRRKPPVAIGPADCRGWPASGPGRLRPGPLFLTGVSAEAPRSSMTSRVRSPGTFRSTRCPASTVMLEAGGADTYTQRAVPGSKPRPGLLHLPPVCCRPVSAACTVSLGFPRGCHGQSAGDPGAAGYWLDRRDHYDSDH
jgi:hypothetical protein